MEKKNYQWVLQAAVAWGTFIMAHSLQLFQIVVVSKSTCEFLGRNFDYIFVFPSPSNSIFGIQVNLCFYKPSTFFIF